MNRRDFLARSTVGAVFGGLLDSRSAQQSPASPLEESLRQKLSHDALRPQYHLIPQAGRVGDPCAPRFFNGRYHLFYHNNFGGHGWAHASSADLVHWDHLPIALSPTAGFYDAYGCFTGSVLPGTEVPSVIYAAVTKVARAQETIRAEGLREVQCIATSTDPDLRSWQKVDHPVIEPPSAALKIVGFRDPFAWKDGDVWYAGVGSGFPQKGGNVLLYRSSDARHFEYQHPLAQGTWNGKSFTNPVGSGEMWECPDFFPLQNKHVLIYSTEYITYWEVGTLDAKELRFHSERKGFLDHGAYYAPKTMIDGKGRRLLWGWIQETRSAEAIQVAGWSGAISLPRVLSVDENARLCMEVPAEFAALRTNTTAIKGPLPSGELEHTLARTAIHNHSGEISCTFKTSTLDYGLELYFDTARGSTPFFKIEAGVPIGATPSVIVGDRTLALSPDDLGYSTLELWIDASILELFVDARQVITVRSYAGTRESQDIFVKWRGDSEALVSLTISDITPVSPDRMTT